LPLAAVLVAHYGFVFENTSLAVIFITFGAPSAVSSYIMAKSMKSDAEVAGQVLLLSTIISTFTIFLGLFLMKNLGWIA
jgi:predicted permease